jgi:hypothetical protein
MNIKLSTVAHVASPVNTASNWSVSRRGIVPKVSCHSMCAEVQLNLPNAGNIWYGMRDSVVADRWTPWHHLNQRDL